MLAWMNRAFALFFDFDGLERLNACTGEGDTGGFLGEARGEAHVYIPRGDRSESLLEQLIAVSGVVEDLTFFKEFGFFVKKPG